MPPARIEQSAGGLGAGRVAAWKQRLRAHGGNPLVDPMVHMDATQARSFYGYDPDARTIPDGFECYLYTGSLARTGLAVSSLRSPAAAVWNERAERSRPAWVEDDALVVTTLLNAEERPLFLARYGDLPLRGSMAPVEPVEIVLTADLLGRRRVLTEAADVAAVFVGTVLARATAAFVARLAVTQAVRDTNAATDVDDERAAVDLIANALGDLAGSQALLSDSPVLLRETVLAVIERRFTDPRFDVESIAAELFVSRRHLYRAFEGADQSLAGLIAERRIEAAKGMIRTSPSIRVSVLARRCGFASMDTFRSRFRAIVGVSPRDYRDLEERRRDVN